MREGQQAAISICREIAVYSDAIFIKEVAAFTFLTETKSFKLSNDFPSVYIVKFKEVNIVSINSCLLYTSPSPRDVEESRMPSSA